MRRVSQNLVAFHSNRKPRNPVCPQDRPNWVICAAPYIFDIVNFSTLPAVL
jgi:hypothetical protein